MRQKYLKKKKLHWDWIWSNKFSFHHDALDVETEQIVKCPKGGGLSPHLLSLLSVSHGPALRVALVNWTGEVWQEAETAQGESQEQVAKSKGVARSQTLAFG